MAMAHSLRCLFLLAVSGLTADAQTTQSQPFDLPGEAPVFMSQTNTSKFNASTMGLRISSTFDDNALNSPHDHRPDFPIFIQPHLGWHVSGARTEWVVDYTLGLARSEKIAANDSLSHLLDGRCQVNLTKRLGFRVHEAFLSSTNPFDQLQASGPATGPSASNLPPETASLIPAEVRTEQANIDAIYILSAHSTTGVGGEFFGARYSLPSGAVSSNQVLQNSSSSAGRSYYMHQITRHQWTGVNYRVRKSIFNNDRSSSFVHSLAYTHAIAISPAMVLSLFVGPERSVTQNVTGAFTPLSTPSPIAQTAWQWSGGVMARWSGRRSRISADLSRRIDSGGLLGAARLSTGSAEMSRQFARQWATRLLVSYDHSNALLGPGTLSYVSGVAGLTRKLTPNLLFEFQYWRVHMSSNGSLPASLLADHNRISMSLVYERQRPLGR